MKIIAKCPCGACLVLDDPKGCFINRGGAKDENGDTYLVESKYREWKEEHSACIIDGLR